MLAFLSFSATAVTLARDVAPQTALALSPSDPGAKAALADQLLEAGARSGRITPDVRRRASLLAAEAIAGSALDPRGYRVLGMLAQEHGGLAAARPLMAMSQTMSRRDLGTQLWYVEERVAANDIPGVLHHYDVALTTLDESWATLIPILNNALSEPTIRAALVPYVRGTKRWVPNFLNHATAVGNAAAVAEIMTAARTGPAFQSRFSIVRATLAQLAAERRFDEARRLYEVAPGASPAVLRSLRFDAAGVDPRMTPVSWAPLSTGDVGASFTGPGGTGPLVVSGSGLSGATVAQKLLYLPAGSYRVSANYRWGTETEDGGAALTITCPRAETPLVAGSIRFAHGSDAAAGTVTIPADCPAQLVQIGLIAGEAAATDLTVTAIDLRRTPG